MFRVPADERRGDLSAGNLDTAQRRIATPSYSDAQIRFSIEHGGAPERSGAWAGGVGAAGPGESTPHLATEHQDPVAGVVPPAWAKLPPNATTMPKRRAALPAHKEERAPFPSGLTERTPSPVRIDEEVAEEMDHPPQPSMNFVEFDSIEEMRENLLLESMKPTEKQLRDRIWELGPNEQKFQLKKGSDGKHRWHATKVLKMETIGLTIRIAGQHHKDALQDAQARLIANTTDYRSPEELASPPRERILQRYKEVAPKKGTRKGERQDPQSSGVKGEGYEHPSSAGEPRGDLPAGGGRPEPDSGTTATGSAKGRSSTTSAARPPQTRAKPWPQQPPIADPSANVIMATETKDDGSVAPEGTRRAFARLDRGVTVGKPLSDSHPPASSASSSWQPSLDASRVVLRQSTKAVAEDESATTNAKWAEKKSQSESSDWMTTAPIPPPITPTLPKQRPWKRCTLCNAEDHLAENRPRAMMFQETVSEMQADEENEAEGTAEHGAPPEITGEATYPAGEPQWDLPAGSVADPEVHGTVSADSFTSSRAEVRHDPRPVDQDGGKPK